MWIVSAQERRSRVKGCVFSALMNETVFVLYTAGRFPACRLRCWGHLWCRGRAGACVIVDIGSSPKPFLALLHAPHSCLWTHANAQLLPSCSLCHKPILWSSWSYAPSSKYWIREVVGRGLQPIAPNRDDGRRVGEQQLSVCSRGVCSCS